MFKLIYKFTYLLLFINIHCSAQDNKIQSTHHNAVLKFDEYKIDSCLSDLFYTIVEADSTHERFPSHLYYYSLQFQQGSKIADMVIVPQRWSKYLPKDCLSLIEVNGMSFVGCGDIKKSSFFQYKGKIEKKVRIGTDSKYDSLDTKQNLTDWNHAPHAIVGSFKLCNQGTIDLHINTGLKIEMKKK